MSQRREMHTPTLIGFDDVEVAGAISTRICPEIEAAQPQSPNRPLPSWWVSYRADPPSQKVPIASAGPGLMHRHTRIAAQSRDDSACGLVGGAQREHPALRHGRRKGHPLPWEA